MPVANTDGSTSSLKETPVLYGTYRQFMMGDLNLSFALVQGQFGVERAVLNIRCVATSNKP